MVSCFRRARNGTPIKEGIAEAILAGNQNCEFGIHSWQIVSPWIFVLVRDQPHWNLDEDMIDRSYD
jgi:hypothetical protein